MFLSIPYRSHPHSSFWGPPTASSNFCEEDYIITQYIAEFINTLTNLAYIMYSLHGLHRLYISHRLTIPSTLPLLGLAGVGICSATFHTTLLEIPQFADDLSMVFPTAFILLRILTFQSQHATRMTILFFSALAAIYTIHLTINKPILHSLTFGIMVHFIRTNIFHLLTTRIPDHKLQRKMKQMTIFGATSFALGFFLWLVDRFACTALTTAKHYVGMPWGFLLELHGWWHVLTGVGAYVFIVLADHLTSDEAGKDPEDAFGWPGNWVVGLFAADSRTSHGSGGKDE